MHEHSLVRSLLTQVQQIALLNGSNEVTDIEVEVGPLSGIESSLVESAFTTLRMGTCAETSKLTVRHVPLIVACQDCGTETELECFRFRCSECQSGSVKVIQGEIFRLLTVTLAEPKPFEPTMADAVTSATTEEKRSGS